MNIPRILVIMVLAVALIPASIGLHAGVDTSGWDASVVSIWDIIPIIVMITVVLGFLGLGILKVSGRLAVVPVVGIAGIPVEAFAVLTVAVLTFATVVYMRQRSSNHGIAHRKIPDLLGSAD